MKISLIVGTRPQIIKSQPIIKELVSNNIGISIIHTGQHYDYQMSKAFFDEMKIRDPDFNLGIKGGSPTQQLAKIISSLKKPLESFKPDFVIVPGDTRSALAAALCSFNLGFRIAHVEAGARSMEFDMEEEINRRLIDHCSNILFAPTKNCYKNLKRESVWGSIYFTGDTMYDVFLEFKNKLKLKKRTQEKFVLLTLHRKNNIENYNKIKKIIQLAKKIGNSEYEVIFPLHPHTEKQIRSFGISLKGIHITKPLKYSHMLQLLCDASLLVTDSGGLQKEALWLNTPCITLRKRTEWVETLLGKHNILLDTFTKSSLGLIKNMIKQKRLSNNRAITSKFGNGRAAQKITSILLNEL